MLPELKWRGTHGTVPRLWHVGRAALRELGGVNAPGRPAPLVSHRAHRVPASWKEPRGPGGGPSADPPACAAAPRAPGPGPSKSPRARGSSAEGLT